MRPVARQSRIHFATAALALICGSSFLAHAQTVSSSSKKTEREQVRPTESASIARGLIGYRNYCAICHFSQSDAKKVGPGLKDIYTRGKFADGSKVNDPSVGKWILNGGKNMPPFKAELNQSQLLDLVAYLKTL
jgi:mono/diheme cytochrome c family protein